MIYVKFSSPDVSVNLAAEYYFAAVKPLGDEIFMLWQPRPTIVVGNFQNIHEEVDVAYAKSRGIDIVRRLSGGGTVYQDSGSIQYAFIADGDRDINFRRYLEPMVAVLRELGINATADGRNDICADGKKVSGNAQYRVGNVTVHHGTLLFSADIGEMERSTRPPEYKISSKSIKSVRERVVNMCTLTDKVKTPSEFMDYLADRLGGKVIYVPTEGDIEQIRRIADEKFRTEKKEGLAAKSPAFDLEKTVRFNGGVLTLSLKVKSGKIESARLSGDFFTSHPATNLTDALRGVTFTREEVKLAVTRSAFEVMGMDNATLAEKLSEDV